MTMETVLTVMTVIKICSDDQIATVIHFEPRPTHGLILTIVVTIIMVILTFALDVSLYRISLLLGVADVPADWLRR